MDFAPTEERRLLAESLRRFLADRAPLAARHAAARSAAGWDPALWDGAVDLGALAALAPEEAGGLGGTGFDIATVFEEVGRALAALPLLPALMAGRALLAAGRADLLAPALEGRERLALALHEPGARFDWRAPATRAAGGRLTGAKTVVAWGAEAEAVLMAAEADGVPALFLVRAGAPGLAVRGYPTVDGLRAAEIVLDGTPAERIAAEARPALAEAEAAGLLALAAEALGAMERTKEITLGYLATRRQFGVPIGSFQALQHRMVDLLIDIEQMRSAVINAAAAFDRPGPARDRALSAAKHRAGRTGRRVAEEAIQMHGGMGMTWEYPVGHYAKRLVMIDHELGDADEHVMRFAALAAA